MKSIYERSYQTLLRLLVQARKEAGLTQQQLATNLRRPQSFVSKIENGERRLDVVEFLTICRHVSADPHQLIEQLGVIRKSQ